MKHLWALPTKQLAAWLWSPWAGMPLKVSAQGRETSYQVQILWLKSHITLYYIVLRFCLSNFDFCLSNFDFVLVVLNHGYILCAIQWMSEHCHQTLLNNTFTTRYFNKTPFAYTFDSGSLSSLNLPCAIN